MKYVIGFKSGKYLVLDIKDGVDFVNGIISDIASNTSSAAQWYSEPGILMSVNEIEFIVPFALAKID